MGPSAAHSCSFYLLSPLLVHCSSHIPPTSELHREWLAYQEKLRTAIECFQVTLYIYHYTILVDINLYVSVYGTYYVAVYKG